MQAAARSARISRDPRLPRRPDIRAILNAAQTLRRATVLSTSPLDQRLKAIGGVCSVQMPSISSSDRRWNTTAAWWRQRLRLHRPRNLPWRKRGRSSRELQRRQCGRSPGLGRRTLVPAGASRICQGGRATVFGHRTTLSRTGRHESKRLSRGRVESLRCPIVCLSSQIGLGRSPSTAPFSSPRERTTRRGVPAFRSRSPRGG